MPDATRGKLNPNVPGSPSIGDTVGAKTPLPGAYGRQINRGRPPIVKRQEQPPQSSVTSNQFDPVAIEYGRSNVVTTPVGYNFRINYPATWSEPPRTDGGINPKAPILIAAGDNGPGTDNYFTTFGDAYRAIQPFASQVSKLPGNVVSPAQMKYILEQGIRSGIPIKRVSAGDAQAVASQLVPKPYVDYYENRPPINAYVSYTYDSPDDVEPPAKAESPNPPSNTPSVGTFYFPHGRLIKRGRKYGS